MVQADVEYLFYLSSLEPEDKINKLNKINVALLYLVLLFREAQNKIDNIHKLKK